MQNNRWINEMKSNEMLNKRIYFQKYKNGMNGSSVCRVASWEQ